jgi:hypothetical protein
MIRLVTLLKRKSGTTHEEFLRHWIEVHGPLIANSSAANYVLRYEQHPVAWPSPGSAGAEPEWDGVTIQEFASVESFWAHTTEGDFPAMQEDIARFLDPTALRWTLTEAPTIVIDRR